MKTKKNNMGVTIVFALIVIVSILFILIMMQNKSQTTSNNTSSSASSDTTSYTSVSSSSADVEGEQTSNVIQAVIKTDKGDIEIELREDKAPKTVANFVKLAKDGFYNGLTFHRREEGFVIQGGDPNGDGTGGPGYTVEAEITDLNHTKGALAMARLPDYINPTKASSGSQFYITLDATPFLDGDYTVFGYVVGGMDVADKIQVGDKIKEVIIK
jgi:peptidyl-prolyl cis-trans isomerase B (cyclophilin B)